MNNELLSYSLEFNRLRLNLLVDMDSSVSETLDYRPSSGQGFVFVIGEIWLLLPEDSVLIVDRLNAGNLLVTLNELERQLFKPLINADDLVPVGGWAPAVQDYWRKIDEECATEEDEHRYDRLAKCLLVEGLGGRIGVYEHKGVPIVEVSTPSKHQALRIARNVWSEFDPVAIRTRLRQLCDELQRAVATRIRLLKG